MRRQASELAAIIAHKEEGTALRYYQFHGHHTARSLSIFCRVAIQAQMQLNFSYYI